VRIAFFSKHLPSNAPNGVSVQVHRLANALVGKGHTVTCFTFSPKPGDALYKVETLPADPLLPALFRKFVPAFCFRKIDTRDFDIVHYHGDDYLCRGSQKRVRTFYGSALSEAVHAGRPLRFLYQALFYLFEWISCVRRGRLIGISAVVRRDLPLVKRDIPCGVPLDRYHPMDPKTPHPSILFFGDLKGRKRGDVLVSLFDRVIRPAIPGCTLSIVGPTPVAGPGVVFLGHIGEVQLIKELQQSWILCMPSSYEGFGVPAIEAMACGTIAVGTRCAGLQEIIVDGENGLLCPVSMLGPVLIKAITDTRLRDRIVQAGLSCAQKYDIERIAEDYSGLYQSLVSKSRSL
jgi:phosphatidyl-myo-inositol alpha-mannosyltransferase